MANASANSLPGQFRCVAGRADRIIHECDAHV